MSLGARIFEIPGSVGLRSGLCCCFSCSGSAWQEEASSCSTAVWWKENFRGYCCLLSLPHRHCSFQKRSDFGARHLRASFLFRLILLLYAFIRSIKKTGGKFLPKPPSAESPSPVTASSRSPPVLLTNTVGFLTPSSSRHRSSALLPRAALG